MQVTFTDLTEKDQDELGKCPPAEVSTFTTWKRHAPRGDEKRIVVDCVAVESAFNRRRRPTQGVPRACSAFD